jgi:hypothetical protein
MIALIVTRKRGDGRYYFALGQTNNIKHFASHHFPKYFLIINKSDL